MLALSLRGAVFAPKQLAATLVLSLRGAVFATKQSALGHAGDCFAALAMTK
jgi:hypothetical protein